VSMNSKKQRRCPLSWFAVVSMMVPAVVLGGCGSSGSSSSSASSTSAAAGSASSGKSSGSSTKVTISYSPDLGDALPVYAKDLGDLSSRGINATLTASVSSAQEVPELLNGQLTVGGISVADFLSALSQGIPLRVMQVGYAGYSATNPNADAAGLVAAPNSGIKSLADLRGKTVAQNEIGNNLDVDTRELLARAGVTNFSTTTIPVPTMYASIKTGKVAAGALIEPFLTMAESQGAVYLGDPLSVAPNSPANIYVVSAKFAAANPSAVSEIAAALQAAGTYVNSHPAYAKGIVEKLSGAPLPAGTRVGLFTSSVTAPQITTVGDLLLKYKSITKFTKMPSLSGVFVGQA
jgi:ABC-type nitrate/sulfonate/bicarbonate transport system substrate-binding protein